MAKEFFKDLPNTTTPLTASRLNGLLDGEEPMGNLVVDSIRTKNMFNIKSMYGATTGGANTDISTSNNVQITSITNSSVSFTTSANWNGVACDFIEVKPSNDYILSFQSSAVANQMFVKICLYDGSKTFIQDIYATGNLNFTITTTSATKYVKVIIEKIESSSSAIILSNIQLEEGSTATAYTSHQNLNAKEPAIVYYGSLKGGASVTLTDVKRYLKVYFNYKDTQTITYEIDTSLAGSSNLVYGSGVGIAYDEAGGLDYYISESSFNKSNNSFTHTRTGYFKLPNTFASRNAQSIYVIYQIETYD